MTTCRDTITSAMRELGVLRVGATPKASEETEGLSRLQAIYDGLFGNGVGDSLLDQDISADTTLLADTRALITTNINLTFPELPFEGARIQVKDMGLNGATLNGNGRLINGASTVTLPVGGDSTYIYMAPNWALVSPLTLDTASPLGEDEFFTLALAKRLVGPFGAPFPTSSEPALLRAANRIRARFATQAVIACDDAVQFLSRQSYGVTLNGTNP